MKKILVVGASLFLLSASCLAQTPPAAPPVEAKPSPQAPLPPDARSSGQITLQGRPVKYTAVAGSIPALDEEGVSHGDFSYVAYYAEAADVSKRPVTFVYNGGPLASSRAMQLAIGPKRLPPHGSSLPPSLIDNADSWLDFTDLVFVDPIGTGWSRPAGDAADAQKRFWGIAQDADSLSKFVQTWVTRERRWQSPKYLAGVSYGGFRIPKMAKVLGNLDVPLSGLVMLSPAIDMVTARGGQHPLEAAILLPTLTAAAIEKKTGKDIDPAQLAEVEHYALTEYATDLLRGVNDRAAIERMSAKVAKFTGLDLALVQRLGARIDSDTFRRELWRDEGKIGGVSDVMMAAYDAEPISATPSDSYFTAGSQGVSAVVDYISNVLKWKVGAPYNEGSAQASMSWEWNPGGNNGYQGWATPELDVSTDLRGMLAANDKLKVLIAHGATDLNTVYMGSKMIVDQIPDFGDEHRLQLKVYPGGHGFFISRESSRRALHDDVRTMYARQIE